MVDLSNRDIKRILVECPDTIKSQFNAADDLFEPDLSNPHWLLLPLSPTGDEYKRVANKIGDGDLLKVSTTAVIAPVSVSRTIRVKVISCDWRLFLVLQRLNSIAISNKTTLRIRDYCNPEADDVLAAGVGTEPYTERFGLIDPASFDAGAIVGQLGAGFLPNGFSFEFLQVGVG